MELTQKTVEIAVDVMRRIRDGRTAETWATWNFFGALQQIGAVDESIAE